MEKCYGCKLEFGNHGAFMRHKNECDLNEEKIKLLINDYVINELTTRQIKKKYNISFLRLRKLFAFYGIGLRNLSSSLLVSKIERSKHSEESKKKISEKRKEYLRLNPEKHPWKLNSKFKSEPCELLKLELSNMGIKYISEFSVVGRNFSIDIAIPERKIAIEVNGNQHYNSNGALKEYYQERHNYLMDLGWVVNELHYSIPYSKNIKKILNSILEKNKIIYDFDYDDFLRKKLLRKSKNICKCGKEILHQSKSCIKCSKPSKMPDRLNLMKDISILGYAGSGRKYKVSPTTIKRWEMKKEAS
jgi:hypothetical protein